MLSATFNIKCDLITKSGKYDISNYVKSIIIQHSIRQKLPRVIIVVEKVVEQITSVINIISAHLQIESIVQNKTSLVKNVFDLYPSEVTLDITMQSSRKQLPSQSSLPLYFTIAPCYDYAYKTHETKIFHNTNVEKVLDFLVKENGADYQCKYPSKQNIEQLVFPPRAIIDSLNYFNFTFSFTENINLLTINYDYEKRKPLVVIQDVKEHFQKDDYDIEIEILDPVNSKDKEISQKHYFDKKFFISTYTQVLRNQVGQLLYNDYVFINKPSNKLFEVYRRKYNDVAVYYRKFDLTKNSCLKAIHKNQIFSLTNFTGNDYNYSSVNSKFQEEVLKATKIMLKLENILNLENLYVGSIVKLQHKDLNLKQFMGLFALTDFQYVLTREKSADWQNYVDLIVCRTNMVW